MSLLKRLTPTNLTAEKEKFLADPSYNPQFTYEEAPKTKQLEKYGLPERKLVDLAQTIVDRAYAKQTEAELRAQRGHLLTQDEVTHKIQAFLEMHQLEDRYKLAWSKSFVARTTINKDTIKLRLPCKFREQGLLSMIYHEIGTHALRRVNYEEQPWFEKKKDYGFRNYLQTEEGLAILHSLLPQDLQLAYSPALRYLAVDYAQKHSFAESWQFLADYIEDENRRFVAVFRQKRGLVDSSQPGGFTKDLVYFAGLVEVWRYLSKHNFDPTDLYWGKMALVDASKAKRMNPEFKPVLPSFFVVDQTNYRQKMKKIGKVNFLKKV